MGKDPAPSAPTPGGKAGEVIIPVVEETARAKPVKSGAVRVEKHVEKHVRKIETPLLRENVEIRRVPVNRVVTETPGIRQQGETTIIPVVEEEVVISKRLVVTEEIHLIHHRTEDRSVKEVALNHERAEVQRLDAQGKIVDRDPRQDPGRGRIRRSLLK